jgi:hypothetical protein
MALNSEAGSMFKGSKFNVLGWRYSEPAFTGIEAVKKS